MRAEEQMGNVKRWEMEAKGEIKGGNVCKRR
jgi:hypothetical protein